MLGHILPLVIRRTGHNCQIQFALDGPTAIKPVVNCQLLASLDNSLTQCGSVCPVRGW